MAYKAKITPKLLALSQKGIDGKEVGLLLADGKKVFCKFEMLTYANISNDDDTDVMVACVKYGDGFRELLAEEDIKEVFDYSNPK